MQSQISPLNQLKLIALIILIFSFKITTMDCRTLDITIVTCLKGLELSELFSETRVVASIVGGSLISRQETPVCTYKGIGSPTWDYPMRFYLEDPVKLLLDNWTEDKQAKEGSCPVVTPSGKHRGCLVFKYDFGHGTIRGAPKKAGENLINPAWSSQLLTSRHHGGCLSAPKVLFSKK
ncbi:hypothetical protein NC652_012743 [Populus alba x Populus x berolinensis]|nr:hypothetical protein NC652_012743 [Populus alba x Populus x berolinensis]